MKKEGSKRVRSFRQLTEAEQKEEQIYRRQLRDSWSFLPGEHPVDVWHREHDEEEK